MGQVRHHQESTQRQYALKDKALELGWSASLIRILDKDLGVSAAHAAGREDFKTLMADISMGLVGAVFALEVSRLARSCADWHRLVEICALSGTLIIDEDGCYHPGDFNDRLLLGLKGTMSQAELHFLRLRLQGGQINKAKKGELRFQLPTGFCYDAVGKVTLDADAQVRGAIGMLFAVVREAGSAYGALRRLAQRGLEFPKRVHDGNGLGKLVWERLKKSRVISIIKNPAYAGVYFYGRARSSKEITPDGQIRTRKKTVPMSSWHVMIKDHHEGYITWEQFLANQAMLEKNRANSEKTLVSGPAREGAALLQGLLLCGRCGHRVMVHYGGDGGLYPTYDCKYLLDQAAGKSCMSARCDLLDAAVSSRVLEILKPAQIEVAVEALRHVEQREQAVLEQWRMRIERSEYEAQLAQRRYEEVDPSNRLVGASLERYWNEALQRLEAGRREFAQYQRGQACAVTPEQKAAIFAMAQDFERLWNAPTTQPKDRKRILRLLIKDITVEKTTGRAVLGIRWQGGAAEEVAVTLPLPTPRSYAPEVVQKVRELAENYLDHQIAARLGAEGIRGASGKPLTPRSIAYIRYEYRIAPPELKHAAELTVQEVAARFGVTRHVIYSWIEKGLLPARRLRRCVVGTPYRVTLDPNKEEHLRRMSRPSKEIVSASSNGSEQLTDRSAV
jgi:excisionase family DNA binding protein